MQVFTSEFIAQLNAAYGPMPEHLRPLLWQIACSPANSAIREEIEECVAELHPDDVPRYIERLQKSNAQGPAFQNTYHELVAGHLLRKRGFAPRYDPTIVIAGKTRTPDWDVPATPETPQFLCDVFTANPEVQRAKGDAAVRDLTSRLGAIPVGVVLMITTGRDVAHEASKSAAKTARQVEHWLRAGAAEGDSTSAGGFTFSVIRVSPAFTKVQFIAPVSTFWVDDDPLAATIKEKVAKYAGAGMPVVVAIFADFLTAVGIEEVERAIRGNGRASGVFSREALSAILWIRRVGETWDMRPFSNPAARQPLAEELFA
jgi:hypothetical protein